MNKKSLYQEYCTGCGLCVEGAHIEFEDKRGFDYPIIESVEQIKFCKNVCPVNALAFNELGDQTLWGHYKSVFRGWSLDNAIRFKAASGGVITSLCLFLINTKRVDYVLHIGEKNNNPLSVQLYCDNNYENIIMHSASRYISGLTYFDIHEHIQKGKHYAIVGKPCDIEALTNLFIIDPQLKESIKYRLTFFCAGAPSRKASMKLIENFGVSLDNVKKITYRGNGWPGLTIVTTKENSKNYTIEYIDSWNKILGRDVMKMCKLCINGIGECADISCGDLWYLDENKKPIFINHEGQNIVFARTELGYEILKAASENLSIHLEPFMDMDNLPYIQPNHFAKRSTMLGKIIGLKLICRDIPLYNYKGMKDIAKNIGFAKLIKAAFGAVKRVIKGTL